LLYAHRSSNVVGAFGFVRGLGVWSHPNFDLADLADGSTGPTPNTDEAKGNFILINGRHYGFDVAATTTSFGVMITKLCGEQ
jgi:hypothetical protein